MKAMLYLAVEGAPSAENVEPEVASRHLANFDEKFFHYCDQELKKINTFYSGISFFSFTYKNFDDNITSSHSNCSSQKSLPKRPENLPRYKVK